MKVAISVQGNDLSSPVDPRFGRAQGFLIVDTETDDFEYVPNPNVSAASGAGIAAAQMIANKGVSAVITGQIGPNAFGVLDASGIRVYTGAAGSAAEALEAYKAGKLSATGSATTTPQLGVGPGWYGPGRGGFGPGRCCRGGPPGPRRGGGPW